MYTEVALPAIFTKDYLNGGWKRNKKYFKHKIFINMIEVLMKTLTVKKITDISATAITE